MRRDGNTTSKNLPTNVVGNMAVEGEKAACGLAIYGSKFFNSTNKLQIITKLKTDIMNTAEDKINENLAIFSLFILPFLS
jgi:hypothetical protein